MLSGFGWSTDNVWDFPLPITGKSYCYVTETEIINVTDDDGPSPTSVYFHENFLCI